MLPESKPTDDSETQLSKYLAWKDKDEVKTIPKEKLNDKPKEDKPDWADKKNDDSHEYEYSNNTEEDDKDW